MGRFVRVLLILVAAAAAFTLYSYAGARFTAGRVVGSNPPFSDRTITFAFDGVPELPGRPRAWVIDYRRSRLPGVRRAQIFVSPTGRLIGTRPPDLDVRLDAWERSRLPE